MLYNERKGCSVLYEKGSQCCVRRRLTVYCTLYSKGRMAVSCKKKAIDGNNVKKLLPQGFHSIPRQLVLLAINARIRRDEPIKTKQLKLAVFRSRSRPKLGSIVWCLSRLFKFGLFTTHFQAFQAAYNNEEFFTPESVPLKSWSRLRNYWIFI